MEQPAQPKSMALSAQVLGNGGAIRLNRIFKSLAYKLSRLFTYKISEINDELKGKNMDSNRFKCMVEKIITSAETTR
jgi:hypothetical protein